MSIITFLNKYRIKSNYISIILFPFSIIYSFFYHKKYLNDKKYILLKFKNKMGYKVNLENPANFNEKLQWLKLYNRKTIYSSYADKYSMRDIIKNKLGNDADNYLIPLIFQTTKAKNLTMQILPDYPVIVKTNHDQGSFKIIYNKNNINLNELRNYFNIKLKINFYWTNREWPYKLIKPRIIIEKLLLTENKELPFDIKFHCFHGKVKIIQLSGYDSSGIKKFGFFDINYQSLDKYLIDGQISIMENIPPTPINLNKMIEIAEKISNDIIYIRVDMYDFEDNIYIGELTFFPTAGYIKYFNNEYLDIIGGWINLNNIDNIQ